MSDVKNIVIIGGSCAGLSVAHYFLKHTYPVLKSLNSWSKYKVIVINPSTHFYWRPAAPRACVSTSTLPHDQLFTPIEQGFKQYDEGVFVLITGEATSLDTEKRTVTYRSTDSSGPESSQEETIPYHSLVIASGTVTPTPLTSLHGSHTLTAAALDNMNQRFAAKPTEIVIAGGGPVGVETAGEIGNALNGAAGLFASRPANPTAKVTLLAGGGKLLPVLSTTRAAKAERFLNGVGVDVVYDVQVTSTSEDDSSTANSHSKTGSSDKPGRITLHLSNSTTMEADIYIPAMGTKPCSSYLPKNLLTSQNRVETNPTTLRVDAAGPRVYCVGDVGSYTPGGILSIHDAIPVAAFNLSLDLGVQPDKRIFSEPDADPSVHAEMLKQRERHFADTVGESQVVPVGWKNGVGAFKGWNMPSTAVWALKGRNYMIDFRKDFTEGKKWTKV